MVLETIQPVLSNYFLNPAGLIALSALLPLIIFYLIKRKPERKTMPSMMFFRSDSDMESTSQAFRRIARNLILLLHMLIVIGFAVALAEPFVHGAGSPEKATLVLDQSASMQGDFNDAQDFLTSNLGEQNSVILVDNEARLVAEDVSEDRARSIIMGAKLKDTETDIASGLEVARREGETIIVGSDLDQSVNQRNIREMLQNFRSDGVEFRTMRTERRNAWGVTGLEVGRDNTSLKIKNFQNQENSIQLSGATDSQLTIPGNSVETVTVESKTGRNKVSLPEDGFSTDNTAYFYIPGEKNFQVVLISDEENPYLMKVFELVEFTSIEYRQPPVEDELEADFYIIGKTDRMLSETAQQIQSDVEDGGDLVLFGAHDLSELGFSGLPVEDKENYVNRSVTVAKPTRITLGEMEIKEMEMKRGEQYSSSSNALVKSDYGEGEILVYNIQDSRFNKNFLYPVFWKEISSEMLERKSINQLNLGTGTAISEPTIVTPSGKELSGRQELEQTGFYDTSRGTVAANILSPDESLRDEINAEPGSKSNGEAKNPVQNWAIVLLLILSIGEIGYLYRIGDFR